MLKRILITVAVLAVLGVVAWLVYRTWFSAAPANTYVVAYGDISSIVEATGIIQARHQIDVAPEVNGTVVQIAVKPGDKVDKGALLVQLDDPDLVRAVRQAELNVQIRDQQLKDAKAGGTDSQIAIATAQLQQATVARQAAQDDYDAIANKPGASTSQEAMALQAAKVNYEIAKANFDQAVHGADQSTINNLTMQLELSQLTLQAAQGQLASAQITAPFTSTILVVNAELDQQAYARNPIVTLADMTDLEVVAQVDEIDVGAVQVGQPVQITLDAFPGQTLQGQVTDIAPAATPQRGSTVYQTTIAFSGASLDLRADMSTNLTITTEERTHVLLVPNRAIQRIGSKNAVQVWANGRVRSQEVTLGLSNRDSTEVISGLKAGDVVVLP